jgi:hypothetical protein
MERKRDWASIPPTVLYFVINLITWCRFAMVCPDDFPAPRGRFTEPGEQIKAGMPMPLLNEF